MKCIVGVTFLLIGICLLWVDIDETTEELAKLALGSVWLVGGNIILWSKGKGE